MGQYNFPGAYFREVEFAGASRPIGGVDIAMGALVGIFEKGPVNQSKACYSLVDVEATFGGAIKNGYGWYVAKGFFDNGGKTLFVNRVVHYTDLLTGVHTAIKASNVIKDGAAADYIRLEAKSEGAFGNGLARKITNKALYSSTLTVAAVIGAYTLTVASLKNLAIGQTLKLGILYYTVRSFDNATKVITFNEPITVAGAMSAVIVSNEFDLVITYKDAVVETHVGLANQNNVENYFALALAKSKYVVATDLKPNSTADLKLPVEDTNFVKFALGNDGLVGFVNADIIGMKSSKTGIYALDRVTDSFNLFCSESQDANVNRVLLDYCEGRMDAFGITTVPEGYLEEAVVTYRTDTGNFNTSYGALYYLWGYVNDPIGVGAKAEKNVPLVGHIAGYYSKHDRAVGIAEEVAGETAVLKGVNRLERDIDDGVHGMLNSIGVNCLRSFAGLGIVLWGCRTLSSNPKFKYIHARRIFMYCEKSILLGTRWAVFKPTTISTWASIERSVNFFLSNVKGLVGATPAEQYVIICDASNNTQAVIDEGQIKTTIGLNIAGVGEFLLFDIGQMKDGATITE